MKPSCTALGSNQLAFDARNEGDAAAKALLDEVACRPFPHATRRTLPTLPSNRPTGILIPPR